jgi:hypothetical protein
MQMVHDIVIRTFKREQFTVRRQVALGSASALHFGCKSAATLKRLRSDRRDGGGDHGRDERYEPIFDGVREPLRAGKLGSGSVKEGRPLFGARPCWRRLAWGGASP